MIYLRTSDLFMLNNTILQNYEVFEEIVIIC